MRATYPDPMLPAAVCVARAPELSQAVTSYGIAQQCLTQSVTVTSRLDSHPWPDAIAAHHHEASSRSQASKGRTQLTDWAL
jgi:hypothetical protein